MNLQKKKASSSGSSGSSGSNSRYTYTIPTDDKKEIVPQYDVQDILKGVKTVQGPSVGKNIYDSISGKYFSTMDELLAYHGYASID